MMRILKLTAALAVAAGLLLAAAHLSIGNAEEAAKETKEAKEFSYIGNKGCKVCHAGAKNGEIYEKWQSTKHATAFASLPDEDKANTACFACHTTGYGKPGGYAPDAKNAAELEGVGCEACHGPGSGYKAMGIMKVKEKAMANGLIEPDAASCKGCHEGKVPEGHKALPKFDFAAMKPKVEHHKAEKAK